MQLITAFEKMCREAKHIPAEKLSEAFEITQEDSLIDFLDFCEECGCFGGDWKGFLYESIKLYDADPKENYWEPDMDKLQQLYDAVGLTEEMIAKFGNESD